MWDVWAALTEPFPSAEGKLQSIKTVAKQQNTIEKKKKRKTYRPLPRVCGQITHRPGSLTYTHMPTRSQSQRCVRALLFVIGTVNMLLH